MKKENDEAWKHWNVFIECWILTLNAFKVGMYRAILGTLLVAWQPRTGYKMITDFFILSKRTEWKCPFRVYKVSLSSDLPLHATTAISEATGLIVSLKWEKIALLLFIPLWKLPPLLPALSRINSAFPERIDGRQACNNAHSRFGEKNLSFPRVPWKPCNLPIQLRSTSTPRRPPPCEDRKRFR